MNPEKITSGEEFLEIKVAKDTFEVKNFIQGWMIEKWSNAHPSNKKVQWAIKYSTKFREIFDREKVSDPHMVEEYNDDSKRQALLERFESLLYADEQELDKAA